MMTRSSPGLAILWFLIITLSMPGAVQAEEVLKTYHKRYRVYPYQTLSILCEPYTVKRNDWLYKIFRKKGEISEVDFPLFINIFKAINPWISNTDAIRPGQSIMIPLKKINPNEYQESEPGVVDVPVIEFSKIPNTIGPFTKRHLVKTGETVSQLLDKSFLTKDGNLNQIGLKAFHLANPSLNNVSLIFSDSYINLPQPSIVSQSWFISQFPGDAVKTMKNSDKGGEPANYALTPDDRSALKKYASLIGGILLGKGTFYFPRKNRSDLMLDLTETPVIKLDNGRRLLLVPPGELEQFSNSDISRFWPELTFMEIGEAIASVDTTEIKSDIGKKAGIDPLADDRLPADHQAAVKQLLDLTEFNYSYPETISFPIGTFTLNALVGRIKRSNKPDLLINFGTIYGTGVGTLVEMGFDILTLTPKKSTIEIASTLFSSLGKKPTLDPVFVSKKSEDTIIVPGVYITGMKRDILVSQQTLTQEILSFLEEKNIRIFYTQGERKPQS